MDDVIFKDRNKEYGAYDLRRKYPRILVFSVFIGVTIFVFASLSYFYSTIIIEKRKERLLQYYMTGGTEYIAKPVYKAVPSGGGLNRAQLIPKVVDTIPPADTLINRAEGMGTDTTGIGSGSGTGTGTGTGSGQIYLAAENPPAFPGGENERIRFLQQNIHYPKTAKEKNIHGTVYVSFVVETNGSISTVKLLKGIGYGCDEEAIRVIQSMPHWIPGKQNGTPVRVQVVIPLVFVSTSS